MGMSHKLTAITRMDDKRIMESKVAEEFVFGGESRGGRQNLRQMIIDPMRCRIRPILPESWSDNAEVNAKVAPASIGDVSSQRFVNHWEGQSLPRNFVRVKELDLEALVAGSKDRLPQRSAEDHVNLADMRKAEHSIEGHDIHVGLRLFERLPSRRLLDAFAFFHKTGGKRPEAGPGINGSTTQENLVLPFGQAACHHLRVLVMNGLARIAHIPEQNLPRGDFQRDRRSALTAIVHIQTSVGSAFTHAASPCGFWLA